MALGEARAEGAVTDRSFYDELGVDKYADAGAIERAYRRRAQRAHPDKGGSTEEFHAVQLAYDTLSDEGKRKRYDETGETNEPLPEQQAIQVISNMAIQFVEAADLEHDHMIESIKATVIAQMANSRNEIYKLREKAKRRERAIRRVKHKGQGVNILKTALQANLSGIERAIKTMEKDIALGELVLKMLNDYGYEVELMLPRSFSFTASSLRP